MSTLPTYGCFRSSYALGNALGAVLRGTPAARSGRLITGRYFLRAIDHHDIYRGLLRFKRQPELLAHRCDEERRVRGIRLAFIGRQFESEIVRTIEAGPVDNYAIHLAREEIAQLAEGISREDDAISGSFLIRDRPRGESDRAGLVVFWREELGSGVSNGDDVGRKLLALAMEQQLEPIG